MCTSIDPTDGCTPPRKFQQATGNRRGSVAGYRSYSEGPPSLVFWSPGPQDHFTSFQLTPHRAQDFLEVRGMSHLLVVDDSGVDRKLAGQLLAKNTEWTVAYACN